MWKTVTCGWCDGDAEGDYVDNGVGMQQVSAAVCGACGATQLGPTAWESDEPTPEEKRRGWWMGPDSADYMIHVVESNEWFNPREWMFRLFGWAPGDVTQYAWQDGVFAPDLHGVVHEGRVVLDDDDGYRRQLDTRCGLSLRVLGGPRASEPTCLRCLTRS